MVALNSNFHVFIHLYFKVLVKQMHQTICMGDDTKFKFSEFRISG